MQKLGLLESITILVGAMIGSAIFSLLGLTIYQAGPAALLSWFLGGILMLFYGMYMGELASRFPHSGGVFFFPRMAFPGTTGRVLGWLSCWSAILTNCVAIAFGGIYIGLYLSVAFPGAENLRIPIALGAILLCLALNIIRIELTGKINTVVVMALLATMLIYIGAAFFGGSYDTSLLLPFFTQGMRGHAGFLSAIPTAMIGYSGIVALAFMVSEVRNARRTLPLAMYLAMTIVVAVYLLTALATLGLVSVGFLETNPGFQFIPLFGACILKLQGLPWLTAVVSLSSCLALLTTMLVCVSMNARAIQAASLDGILPACLGKNNASGVPAAASFATALAAMAYACFPQWTEGIVNFGAVFNILTMVLTMTALLKARLDRTAEDGIFLAPGGRLLPYIILAILLGCNGIGILNGGLYLWAYTLAFLLLGAAFLVPQFLRKRRSGKQQ